MLCGRVTLFASLPLIDLFVVVTIVVVVVVIGDTFVLIVNTLAKCIRYCIKREGGRERRTRI